MKKKKVILVTGAGGYIGKALTHALISDESTIYAMSWSGDPEEETVDGAIPLMGDVCNQDDLERLSQIPFTHIYHLAARANVPMSVKDPVGDFRANVEGTINILELARKVGVKRFILLSSVSVLDPSNILPYDENASTGPSSPYAAGKLAGEAYCKAYYRTYGLSTGVVRLFNVYGPGFTRYSVWDLTNKILAKPEILEVLGGGEQIRDFLYINDAVSGIMCVEEKGFPGEVYHLSTGVPTRIKDLARLIAGFCGYPDIKIISGGPSWPGDVPKWYADINKIRRLGFSVDVSLEEGVRRTVEWISSQREQSKEKVEVENNGSQ